MISEGLAQQHHNIRKDAQLNFRFQADCLPILRFKTDLISRLIDLLLIKLLFSRLHDIYNKTII